MGTLVAPAWYQQLTFGVMGPGSARALGALVRDDEEFAGASSASSPRTQLRPIQLLLEPVKRVVTDHLGGAQAEDRFARGLDGAAA
ncbi:hypothetical protein ABIC09_004213 [Bradyrhizobium sp. S3.12.5]